MNKDIAYWMVLVHDELDFHGENNKYRLVKKDKMNLIIEFYKKGMSIRNFFELSKESWKDDFLLSDKQIADLCKMKSLITKYAFLAEHLQNDGIEIIPIILPDYSRTLKDNLKSQHLYCCILKGISKLCKKRILLQLSAHETLPVLLYNLSIIL